MVKMLSWLLEKLRIRTDKQQFKDKVMSETVEMDFTSLTHNWDKSKQLFDQLKKKCHPDHFSGDRSIEATRIFQALMTNKFNYEELLKLKEEAEKKLGISL